MPRSKWKGPYLEKIVRSKTREPINSSTKKSEITPSLAGFELDVYNGKKSYKLYINENMIGHKLGEFVPTRKKFSFKKSK